MSSALNQGTGVQNSVNHNGGGKTDRLIQFNIDNSKRSKKSHRQKINE